MRVLLTGSTGQLGTALRAADAPGLTLLPHARAALALPADLVESLGRAPRGPRRRGGGRTRQRASGAGVVGQVRDHVPERVRGERADVVEGGGFLGRRGRSHDLVEARRARRDRRREASWNRVQSAVESDLTQEQRALRRAWREVPRRGGRREHQREVEALARLAPPGRHQVQVDPPGRDPQPRRPERARDPPAALAQDRVGQARELHLDPARMADYYDSDDLAAFPKIAEHAPELGAKFFEWYGAVFADGALTAREKSLIALGVAHAVQCPYCIDAYTKDALEKGCDMDQLTETVHVASAIKGGAALVHGVQMKNAAAEHGM